MGKNHIKRIATPKTWDVKRKITTFITRQNSGAHKLSLSMSLNVILRDLIDVIKNTKEAKYIVKNKMVIVNNKKVRDYRMNVGLFDVITIPTLKENYRILLNTKGKIYAKKINDKEAEIVPYKIENKTIISKKYAQLNLSAGKTIRIAIEQLKNYKTGDTIIFNTKTNKIEKNIELKQGAIVYFTEGKHIGQKGEVQEETKEAYRIKMGDKLLETAKEKFFVLGNKKSEIEL